MTSNGKSDKFYGVYYYSDNITLINSKKITVPKKIEEIKAYLIKNPEDISAIILLGDLYYDLGDFNNAKDNYIKAIEITPSNIVLRLSIAATYRELGEFDEAIKECNKALTQNIEASSTYASLSKTYIYMNNKSLALETARKAYSLDKNDMFSINCLLIADHYNGLFDERDKLFKVLEENKYYDLERTKYIISSKSE